MKHITRMDLFGHQFHFLINKNNSYRTFIGGICSFLCLISLTIVTYFIGKPLWYHRNPTVTTSRIQKSEQSILPLSETDLFFAFTVGDFFGSNFESYKNSIYIEVTNQITDPITLDYTKYEMSYSKCSEFVTKVNGEAVHTFDELYCINLTDVTIASVYNSAFSMINLQLYNCPKNSENKEPSLCAQITKIEDEGNIFMFYYYSLTLYTQPDNYTHPLNMNYKNDFISLLSFEYSNVQILIEKTTVNDDTNWLFDSTVATDYYQVSDTIKDYSMISTEEGDGYLNPMLLIQIYPSNTNTLIKRKYMKIYDIVALLSGMINIVHFAIGVLCYYINLLSQKFFLFRMTFHTHIRNTRNYKSSFSINNSTNKLNTIIKGKENYQKQRLQ